mgnify:FL=1|tara:strand:- start:2344 stop:2850 length:507 start_codon:yes stop_codon:yes gene_type:complete
MTPLPAALGGSDIVGWRLDDQKFAKAWDSGEGAFRQGGRWNSKNIRAVYGAVDPATAILEVTVHKTFRVLDTVPHVLSSFKILKPSSIHMVEPGDIPNPNWLRPGIPSAGQQQFGDQLLADNLFILIPSAVSTHSWNIIFDTVRASGAYAVETQERFALDGRLHPPVT